MGSCHPPRLCWARSTLLTVSGLGEAQRVLSTRGGGTWQGWVRARCKRAATARGARTGAPAPPGPCRVAVPEDSLLWAMHGCGEAGGGWGALGGEGLGQESGERGLRGWGG